MSTITPEIGKVYFAPDSLLVVECIRSPLPTPDTSIMFSGRIIFPGKLVKFHNVGDERHTYNPQTFELIGESREAFLKAFADHLNRTPITTAEAALESLWRSR